MPLRTTRFAVLDTSVYIENFRTGRFTLRVLQSSFIPRCSVVVLYELLRGAKRPSELKFGQDLLKQCRVLTPTQQQWVESAELLHRMRKHQHFDANKMRELTFDVLIALSARHIGATLITCNESDFDRIQQYLPVRVEIWT